MTEFVAPAADIEQDRWIAEDHPEWARRRRVASEVFLPWLAKVKPLTGTTVLEIGCGTGAVCAAFAGKVGRHIGYDIHAPSVDFARRKLKKVGAHDVELHVVAPYKLTSALVEHSGQIDVLLLYAVLEHMTVQERLELLEIAPTLLGPGGVIAVIELPNRLVTEDPHTSQVPFFSQLPDDLALRYWQHSGREDFHQAMTAAAGTSPVVERETLTRWGRGASFHEFEVVFGDLRSRVLAANYEPELLSERPIFASELALARTLARTRPDLAPCFSRYWMDFVLSVDPVDPADVKFTWPWIMEAPVVPGIGWRGDVIEMLTWYPLVARLPVPTSRVVLGVQMPGDDPLVTVRAHDREWQLPLPEIAEAGNVRFVELDLGEPTDQVELALDRSGYLSFLGYEAPAGR